MMGRSSWRPDATVGVVSGLLGVGFMVSAMQITQDPSAFDVIGPRVAPLVVGLATVLCSVALIVQAVRSSRHPETSPTSPDDDHPVGSDISEIDAQLTEAVPQPELSWRRILVTFTLFTAYILVFIPLGYLLSTFAFLIALTSYSEPRKWLRNVLFAAGFSVIVYLLFTRGLRVQLPPGLLG